MNRFWKIIAPCFVLVVVAALFTFNRAETMVVQDDKKPVVLENAQAKAPENTTPQESPSKEATRKKLLDEVRKSVVIISAKSYASTGGEYSPKSWSGTGFIVNLEKGLIATNHHVTGDMSVCTYEVKFSDGTSVVAKLKFFDPLLDFAFLTSDPKDFPKSSIALELCETPVKVNDTIYSMGNSAGDEFSTYKGTVFGIHDSLGSFPEQSFRFSGLTVGGASGSPVFNEDGKVVGIIYGGKFVSGAALPISYIARALKSLNKDEMPPRASLGLILRYEDLKDVVDAGILSEDAKTQYNAAFPNANSKILMVDTRLVESPASSQFVVGDILWKVNDEFIGPELTKFDEIIDSKIDQSVSVQVYRNGKLITISLKPYRLMTESSKKFVQFAGATFFSCTEQIRLMTGDKGPGVYLSAADTTSPFKKLFKESWFSGGRPLKITYINGTPIQSLDDLEKMIPDLLTKKTFDVRFIDFLGQQTFGDSVSADRQERLSILRYDSKFDSPKVLTFNEKTMEWDIKDLKGAKP